MGFMGIKREHLQRYQNPWVFFLCLFCLLLFNVGLRPLATPDEGRYVEIPREMLETNNYVVPHLNGLPYLEKPPLVYWTVALSLKVFGINTIGARFPLVVFGLLGCLIVYAFSRLYQKRPYNLLPPLILGTSVLYFVLSRILVLDLCVTVWMTASLLAFYRSTLLQPSKKRLLFILAYGISMAGSVMTKGLIGIVLTGSIIVLWIFWTRQWRFLRIAFHPLALLSFLLLATPWHVLAWMQIKEFPWFYFIHEHFLRYTTYIHGRYQPFWFFIPIVFFGFFPWTPFLLSDFKRDSFSKKACQLYSFLWIWIGVIFLFFTASHSKLIPYILPIFPPLALLTGIALEKFLEKKEQPSFLFYFHGSLFIFIGIGLLIGRFLNLIQITEGLFCIEKLNTLVIAVALVFIVMGAGLLYKKHTSRTVFKITLVGHVVILMLVTFLDPLIQRVLPANVVANFIQNQNLPDYEVIVYRDYPQDLPVYLNHTVRILRYRGELFFGHTLKPHFLQILNDDQTKRLWEKKPCFIVMLSKRHGLIDEHLAHFLSPLCVVYKREPYLVLSNQENFKRS